MSRECNVCGCEPEPGWFLCRACIDRDEKLKIVQEALHTVATRLRDRCNRIWPTDPEDQALARALSEVADALDGGDV